MPEYWIRRAIAVVLTPFGLALISAVRLLIISDYNTTTAATIASSGGYVNTLLGTLISIIPVFMPYLALLLIAFRRFMLSAMALVAAALISPTPKPPNGILQVILDYWKLALEWIGSNILPAYLIVIAAVLLLRSTRSPRLGSALTVFHWTWALVTVFVLLPHLVNVYPAPRTASYYASFLRQPWLPAEVITATPNQVYSGYVISNANGWFTVLLLKHRTISYIKASNVTSRAVCQTQQTPSPPLIPLLQAKAAALKECPGIDIQTTAKSSPAVQKTGANRKTHNQRNATCRCRSTGPVREKFPRRFEREVDPDGWYRRSMSRFRPRYSTAHAGPAGTRPVLPAERARPRRRGPAVVLGCGDQE